MGFSRWDSIASTTAYASATATRATMSTQAMYDSGTLNKSRAIEEMMPQNFGIRESRDSDFNPKSNAIIIGLDVTGSMGIIAEKLARGKLGELMNGIFNRKPIEDPQVMIMGIGDAFCDSTPLQCSQFEADIKIDESLQKLYLEGGGGGNNFESYDLPWYFAANRTVIDCFEKRGKKGYLFTIGDEMPPRQGMTEQMLTNIFGKTQDIPKSQSEALEAAQEKYDVFHLIVEQGNYCARGLKDKVIGAWRELLGKRAIPLDDWENITEVMIAAMELNEGKSLEEVLANQQSDSVIKSIKHAFGEE